MFRIYERYQYWAQEGLVWTEWYRPMIGKKYEDKKEAQAEVEILLKGEKKKKLKHDYRVEEE